MADQATLSDFATGVDDDAEAAEPADGETLSPTELEAALEKLVDVVERQTHTLDRLASDVAERGDPDDREDGEADGPARLDLTYQ